MVAVWSQQNKFKIWFEIEAYACEAMAERRIIPKEASKAIWKAKNIIFDVQKINEIEKKLSMML